jgi:hypothetical protein
VVKEANVEVYEHATAGVGTVGGSEALPSALRYRSDRPIVLAYKYLSPDHSVAISVLRRKERKVLEAVVDAALYQALVVDTQIMHRLTLTLQNTRTQYLALAGVPDDAVLWSLFVNSVPAKPVARHGELLIPLLVATTADGTGGGGGGVGGGAVGQPTSVELAYLSQHPKLGHHGQLDLSPPTLDLPISALSVEIRLPTRYDVNFTGTVEQVDRFSFEQPKVFANLAVETDVLELNKHRRWDTDGEKGSHSPTAPPSRRTSIPVHGANTRSIVPESGSKYAFERLLVVGDAAKVVAEYGLPPPPLQASEVPSVWTRTLQLIAAFEWAAPWW